MIIFVLYIAERNFQACRIVSLLYSQLLPDWRRINDLETLKEITQLFISVITSFLTSKSIVYF